MIVNLSAVLDHFYTTVLIFVLGVILQGLLGIVLNRIIKQIQQKQGGFPAPLSPRFQTLRSVGDNSIALVAWGFVLFATLSEWGVDITPLLTGAGVLGVAVGFGSQTLVRDIISGIFILVENQYNIEDLVEIAGVKGVVKEVNLRTTVLESPDSLIHIIPNSQIAKVSRYSKKPTD